MKTRPETFDDLDKWQRRGQYVAGVSLNVLDDSTEAGRALNTFLDVCRESDDFETVEETFHVFIYTNLTDEEKLRKLRSYQENFDQDTRWIGLIRDKRPIYEFMVPYALDAAAKRGIEDLPKPIIRKER